MGKAYRSANSGRCPATHHRMKYSRVRLRPRPRPSCCGVAVPSRAKWDTATSGSGQVGKGQTQ